jgi:predicted nuclease of predicted toxin-antitoxin system
MQFLADENFNGKILAGLRNMLPEVDIIRAQDTEMVQSPDPELLAWAAEKGRILLTHDVQTVVGFAYERVERGETMPGIIEVKLVEGIGRAIEDLAVMIGASSPDEFENQVRYIPLR